MYLTVAHPLSDLSHVLSVFPAGEHVGEGERLQTSVNQIRLLGLLLVLLWRRKLVHLFRPQKIAKVAATTGFCHGSALCLCATRGPLGEAIWGFVFWKHFFYKFYSTSIYIHTIQSLTLLMLRDFFFFDR